MNQKAIINGKEYRFIKTETDMITNRTAVLFENEHGSARLKLGLKMQNAKSLRSINTHRPKRK